jgi:hypothetical protein
VTAARFLSWRSPIHSQNAIHDDRSEIYDRANDRTFLMTKPSVPLGLVFSRSGPYAVMGREMEKSALMAVDEVIRVRNSISGDDFLHIGHQPLRNSHALATICFHGAPRCAGV